MDGTREQKDIVEKECVAFPDVAADVINVLLYQGEEVVMADSLWPGPTETVYESEERLKNQFEDLCRYRFADGVIQLMYLIANQSRTDGKMLLRKAGYTGGIYREQYEGKAKDTYPVIEFVLYWGLPRWRSGRSIRQLFGKKSLLDKEWEYIDNLELHVFEMRYLPKETRELFRSDMRIVVDYLAEGERYRSERKIVHKAALIKMIKALSGESDTDGVENWLKEQEIGEEDEITVCELFDQYERKGRREGIERGEASRLVRDVENAMRFFQVTLERACEGLGTTVHGYEQARQICGSKQEAAI